MEKQQALINFLNEEGKSNDRLRKYIGYEKNKITGVPSKEGKIGNAGFLIVPKNNELYIKYDFGDFFVHLGAWKTEFFYVSFKWEGESKLHKGICSEVVKLVENININAKAQKEKLGYYQGNKEKDGELKNADADKLSAENWFYIMREKNDLTTLSDLFCDCIDAVRSVMKIEELKELLEHTHNIILHGAPGTGKTHLAKEIAKVMGAEWKLVQFHPSYDYTDFVEGIRPKASKNGSADGFGRRDGVFKEFCRRTILPDLWNELLNDKPTVWKMSLGDPANPEDKDIKSDCFKNGYIRLNYSEDNEEEKSAVKSFKTMNNGDIVLTRCGNSSIDAVGIITGDYYEDSQKKGRYWRYRNVTWLVKEINRDISSENKKNFKRVSLCKLPNMTKDSVKEIVKEYFSLNKSFVFIIDEINRGELSKIFGELFYSIDPGYRGTAGRVQTQYQNLVPKGDVFEKGFYIPENVYIIGTMNDIDRSVESMDFAMRRRFTFVEIKAGDSNSDEKTEYTSLPMLNEDTLKTEWKKIWESDDVPEIPTEDIRNCMKKLNDKIISEEIGLSPAYQIGAAYFLKWVQYKKDSQTKDTQAFGYLWKYHLEPLLKEYLRGQVDVEEKMKQLEQAYQQ